MSLTVSDIPVGDGKIVNLFFTVHIVCPYLSELMLNNADNQGLSELGIANPLTPLLISSVLATPLLSVMSGIQESYRDSLASLHFSHVLYISPFHQIIIPGRWQDQRVFYIELAESGLAFSELSSEITFIVTNWDVLETRWGGGGGMRTVYFTRNGRSRERGSASDRLFLIKFLSTGEIMEEPVPCGGNYMCPNGTICKERSLYIQYIYTEIQNSLLTMLQNLTFWP